MLTYFWVDLVIICAMSLVLSSVLIWGFGWRHPSSSFERDEFLQSGLFIFLILFFSMWAGGPWLPVWGPLVYGRPLSGPFIIGLFLVLLLLATMHPKRRKPRSFKEAKKQKERLEKELEEEGIMIATAFGIFFWILIVVLLITGVVGYFL